MSNSFATPGVVSLDSFSLFNCVFYYFLKYQRGSSDCDNFTNLYTEFFLIWLINNILIVATLPDENKSVKQYFFSFSKVVGFKI